MTEIATKDEAARPTSAKETTQDITLGIVGSGGDGVISSGELLVSAAAHDGLHATILKQFGPQIRGGESSCRVRISQEETLSYGDALDVLAAFNWADFERFKAELQLRPGLIVIYDSKDGTPADEIPIDPGLKPVVFRVPLHDLAVEATGTALSKNVLLLGVLAEMFGLPEEVLAEAVDRKFRRKGEKIVEANRKALAAGHEYIRDNLDEAAVPLRFTYTKNPPKLLMTGNEALSFGAVRAGCRFYAGYPITPSSDVMEWLADVLPRLGGTMMQTEDEIAAIGMCIGASFGGTKVMTSTAGPGLSLMTEFLGLASIAEVPLVIADIQRVGPSTGIPTKTEQCDFNHAIHAGPGDTPRVVLAPFDVADCFRIAIQAFNIAEAYQTPVIVLSDQYLGQRKESVEPFDIDQWEIVDRRTLSSSSVDGDEPYVRYRPDETGVSPMAIPGEPGGTHTISGLEHIESGAPTSDTEVHEQMNHRRHEKLRNMVRKMADDLVQYFGDESGDLGVVCWGSTSAQVREAARRLNREGHRIKVCVPQLLYPLPVEVLQRFVDSVEKTLWVELNYQAQFYHFAHGQLDLIPERTAFYARSGGMPFSVAEIIDEIVALKERA